MRIGELLMASRAMPSRQMISALVTALRDAASCTVRGNVAWHTPGRTSSARRLIPRSPGQLLGSDAYDVPGRDYVAVARPRVAAGAELESSFSKSRSDRSSTG